MIIDAFTPPQNETFETDVCIVGGGAAGITIAREMIGSGARVCILESGVLELKTETQNLYDGKVTNPAFYPLTVTRMRYFGGSTNVWNGFCRPLDQTDFEARPYIPHSGWPFGLAELNPYYVRAQPICQVIPDMYDLDEWVEGDRQPFKFENSPIRTALFKNSPPTKFGEVYRDDLAKADDVMVFTASNVIDIETPSTPNRVTRMRVARLNGQQFWVRSKLFIIAAGCIENVRLLLSADKAAPAGLGNDEGLVGRYFMDRPHIWKAGKIRFKRDFPEIKFYRLSPVRGLSVVGVFTLHPEALHREEMPNFRIGVGPASAADVSEGAASLKAILTGMRRGASTSDMTKRLGAVVKDVDGFVAVGYKKIFKPKSNLYATHYACEMPPDPDNRITLINERDALGMRRVKLDWRLSSDFERHFLRAHEILGQEMEKAGYGSVEPNTRDSPLNPMETYVNSHHHLGATRMHVDPKHGVVDANSKVHGIANLYIAGSSVFPAYGHANPTLTVVALALRLADHVKARALAEAPGR